MEKDSSISKNNKYEENKNGTLKHEESGITKLNFSKNKDQNQKQDGSIICMLALKSTRFQNNKVAAW